MQYDLPPIVEKLRPFLSATKVDVNKLRTLRLELAEERVKAHELLQTKRKQMLWPKDKDLTELDRRVRLEGDLAPLEKNYDFLVALEEIVSDIIRA